MGGPFWMIDRWMLLAQGTQMYCFSPLSRYIEYVFGIIGSCWGLLLSIEIVTTRHSLRTDLGLTLDRLKTDIGHRTIYVVCLLFLIVFLSILVLSILVILVLCEFVAPTFISSKTNTNFLSSLSFSVT